MADKENKSENKVSDNHISSIEAGGDVYIGSSEQNNDSKNSATEKKPSDIAPPGLTGLLPIYRLMYDNLSPGSQIAISLLSAILGGGGLASITLDIPTAWSTGLAFVGAALFLFGAGYFVSRLRNKCPDCGEPFTFKPLDDAKEIDRSETEREQVIEVERTWKCTECGYSEKRNETHSFEKPQQNAEQSIM